MKITINVPMLPPVECSPNWRGHWTRVYKAKQTYRNAVYYYARETMNGNDVAFEKARLDLTFVFPAKRKRDIDNMIARFKAGQDALVKAGLLPDDSPEYLEMGTITFETDKERAPLTIITLTSKRR